MSVDLKTLTPDTTLPQTGFLFGADSQLAAIPSVYPVANVKDAINSGITTLATGNAIIWDAAAAPVATVTLTQNATLYVNNFRAGGTYKLIVFQDATGGRTLAYDPNFKWPNDVIPTVSSGANAMTVFEFVSNGTYMYGTVSQAYDGSPAPTVLGLFAAPAGDYSTLPTTTSMPTGGAVARAGRAMYYDSTGLLTYAPNNLLRWSQDFRDTATAGSVRPWGWGGTTTVVTNVSGITAPDGTQTASRVSGLSTTDGDIGLSQTATLSPARVIGSIYVRGEGSDIGKKILLRTKRITGTIVTGYTEITLTGDWQRLSASMVMASDNTGVQFILSGAAATNQSSSCLIWGAQLEATTYATTPGVYNATTDAAYFGPRFDYDPATLQPKGLLVEGARTNLLTYSQDFADASWNDYRSSSISAASFGSPDGTNARAIVEAPATAAHFVQRVTSVAISNATVYTISIYAKASGRSFLQIMGDAALGNLGGVTTFNLSTGAVTLIGSGVTSANIVSVGNGWYRCSITAISAGTSARPAIGLSDNATVLNNAFKSYAGDGASGIIIWGAMIEAGAWASSYLPTQASSVARLADTFTLSGYANRLVEAYWIDQETGVASSFPETVVSSGAVTINPPTFGWVTSLRAYTNAYAGDIATPSWIDNSGTVGNRMVTDSTGTLTWAPSNLFSNSASPSQTNTISAGIEGGGDYIVSYYGGGTLALKQTNSAGAVITPSSTGTVSSRNYAKFTVPNGVSAVYIDFGAAATNAQLERVTYQTQPRALIETSGSARFLPRYDFDAATTPARPLGMRIEGARTNLMLWSQDFRNTATAGTSRPWVWGGSTTVSSNVSGIIAPDGTETASRVSGFSTSDGDVGLSQSITLSPATVSASYFVRGEGSDIGKKVLLRIKRIGGTFVTAEGEITLTAEWKRLPVTMTMNADNTGVQVILSGAAASNQASSCLIWNGQLEVGAFATSAIPTTSASFQRQPDIVKLIGTALTVAGAATGSAIVQTSSWLDATDASGDLLASATERRLIYSNGSNTVLSSTDGTTRLDATIGGSGTFTGGAVRSAVAWNASGRSLVANNGTTATDAVNLGTGATVTLGGYGTTTTFNGWVAGMALYSAKLPDATLKAKSTVGASL